MNAVTFNIFMYVVGLVLGCAVGYLVGLRRGEQDSEK